MARPLSKHGSPKLSITITDEAYDTAVKSNSGACLIADAIKNQHPELVNVSVDMATIRATDLKRGVRYTYLTPEQAQYVLLAFDQGWSNPYSQLTVKKAVRINPVIRNRRGPHSPAGTARRREIRLAELRAKQDRGEPLTRGEKISLAKMSNPKPPPERPSSWGPADVKVTGSGTGREDVVVHGGKPIIQGRAHPNLLRGRNRHFGAKLADPGIAFREAVDEAVAERLADSSTS
jgi:hypothetical protein